jgi:hypothetical protein
MTTHAKAWLTKIWIGRHWWYIDTSRRYRQRNMRVFRRWVGVVSYEKAKE